MGRRITEENVRKFDLYPTDLIAWCSTLVFLVIRSSLPAKYVKY